MESSWLILFWIVGFDVALCSHHHSHRDELFSKPWQVKYQENEKLQFYIRPRTDQENIVYFILPPEKLINNDEFIMKPKCNECDKLKIELSLKKYHNKAKVFVAWSKPGCTRCCCDTKEIMTLYLYNIDETMDESIGQFPPISLHNTKTYYFDSVQCEATPTLQMSNEKGEEMHTGVSLDMDDMVHLKCTKRYSGTTIHWMQETGKFIHEGIEIQKDLPIGTKLRCVEVYSYVSQGETFNFTFSRSELVELMNNELNDKGTSSWYTDEPKREVSAPAPPDPNNIQKKFTKTKVSQYAAESGEQHKVIPLPHTNSNCSDKVAVYKTEEVSIINQPIILDSLLNISCTYPSECPKSAILTWYFKKESSNESCTFHSCKCKKKVPCSTVEANLTLTDDFENALFYCHLYEVGPDYLIVSYRITLSTDLNLDPTNEKEIGLFHKSRWRIWVPIVVSVIALVALLTYVAFKLRKRRIRKVPLKKVNTKMDGNHSKLNSGVEVETYACPQELTYAQLEISNTGRVDLKMDEVEPYAEIIGVLAPSQQPTNSK